MPNSILPDVFLFWMHTLDTVPFSRLSSVILSEYEIIWKLAHALVF